MSFFLGVVFVLYFSFVFCLFVYCVVCCFQTVFWFVSLDFVFVFTSPRHLPAPPDKVLFDGFYVGSVLSQ